MGAMRSSPLNLLLRSLVGGAGSGIGRASLILRLCHLVCRQSARPISREIGSLGSVVWKEGYGILDTPSRIWYRTHRESVYLSFG